VRVDDTCRLYDVTPTVLDILGIETRINFDGRSVFPLAFGQPIPKLDEFYITECTWMRKHGWRTPKWKYIQALEPDFHFKPEVELYDLENDPMELWNIAKDRPDIVMMLDKKMSEFIRKREKEVGRTNPIYTNLTWHGLDLNRGFISSEEAYNSMHIASAKTAAKLQQK
jgi:arylsulfatase A-like enzyme